MVRPKNYAWPSSLRHPYFKKDKIWKGHIIALTGLRTEVAEVTSLHFLAVSRFRNFPLIHLEW